MINDGLEMIIRITLASIDKSFQVEWHAQRDYLNCYLDYPNRIQLSILGFQTCPKAC